MISLVSRIQENKYMNYIIYFKLTKYTKWVNFFYKPFITNQVWTKDLHYKINTNVLPSIDISETNILQQMCY